MEIISKLMGIVGVQPMLLGLIKGMLILFVLLFTRLMQLVYTNNGKLMTGVPHALVQDLVRIMLYLSQSLEMSGR